MSLSNRNKQLYFDYAAATPIHPEVLAAMEPFFSEQFHNPSGIYLASRAVKKSIDESRQHVARLLGVRAGEIVFTAGGTESINLAIHGVMRGQSGNVIVTAVEHKAVLAAAEQYDHQRVPVDSQGRVDINALKELIDDNTRLISCMYANNEIGTIQPLKEVVALAEEVKSSRLERGIETPLYIHTDACQAPQTLQVNVAKLGVDLMTLNGAKIYGPKQSGCLYVRGGIKLQPLIDGGGQEKGLRSGTENPAAIVGFTHALDLAVRNSKQESHRLEGLRRLFTKQLKDAVPQAEINGSRKQVLASIINFSIEGLDGERAVMMLDERGIQCATGSACSALGDEESSYVIKAIGKSESEARGSLRFSMGRSTDEAAVTQAVEAISQIINT